MTAADKPYLSLGMMLGDAHVGVLERCLRSVLERSSGPLVDEIVIGWNGENQAAFMDALGRLGYDIYSADIPFKAGSTIDWREGLDKPKLPPLKVVPFEWPERFDVARNLVWKHLTGEWLLWLDADDIVADAGTKEGLAAIEAVERDYGIAPPTKEELEKPAPLLRDWLRQLPPAVNTIFTPYNYTLQPGTDYVTRRQKMKRMVRRSFGHIWYSPQQSGVHEYLMPLGAGEEVCADLFGFLVQHFPSEEETTRSARNSAIVKKLSGDGPPTEARHAYDLGNAQFAGGDIEAAVTSLRAAIQGAQSEMDRYTYRLALCSLHFARGLAEAALQEAWSAVALLPNLRDAYFVAAEALFRMGKWAAVIEWYERGVSKPSTLMAVDQPLMMWVQPRAQASWAYLQMAQPAKALALAREAIERYPKDSLALQVYKDAEEADRLQRLHTAVMDTVELAIPTTKELAEGLIAIIPQLADTRGLAKGLRYKTLAAKLKYGAGTQRRDLEDQLREWKGRGQLPHGGTPIGQPIAFYSPFAAKPWKVVDLEEEGLGGSESSVAYLARELSLLGREVTVFTPGAGNVQLWEGTVAGKAFSVIQRDLHDFDPTDRTLLITCRAPYLVREMDLKGPVWCWHQDNGYENPWFWNPKLARMHAGHLHVSEWARKGLCAELVRAGGEEDEADLGRHAVLGNGIDPRCALWMADEGASERNPRKVVYASDPTRGLETLLDAWPQVLETCPDAQLVVMCGFMVMLALKQDLPGLPVYQRLQNVQRLLSTTKNVNYLGWVSQKRVVEEMRTAGIYCYPGGPMPEGFGVSLVQAQASGCTMLAAEAGALPEVLSPENRTLMAPGHDLAEWLKLRLSAQAFSPQDRVNAATEVLQRHAWPVVAARFLSIIEGKTL